MAKKRQKENEKEKNGTICPHCGRSHPPGTHYCPSTGTHIYQEIIENEIKKLKTENKELKEKRWFHLKLNIFFSAVIILLIILVLVIIFGKGNGKPIKPVPGYLRSGGVTLEYQPDPKYPQLVPDMVEAYLEQFGASGIKSTKESGEKITVKGVIPGKDKPVNAEIRLLALEKINVAPGEKPGGAVETLKNQLAAEKKKREDTENQLAAEKIEKEEERNNRKKLEEKCYDAYFNIAKQCYESSDWNTALEYINKAKQLNNTQEAYNLGMKIQRGVNGSERTVNLSDLSDEIRKKYFEETDVITIDNLPEDITINEQRDQITLSLIINQKGNVKINEMLDKNLEVIPGNQTRTLIQKIRERIEGLSLPPPRDKNRYLVKVKTWRFAFKVKILEKKLILIRRD